MLVAGFESCRSLHGGTVGGFTGKRTFNPNHGVRRRRLVRQRVRRGEGGNLMFHEPLRAEQGRKEGLLDRVGGRGVEGNVTLALR